MTMTIAAVPTNADYGAVSDGNDKPRRRRFTPEYKLAVVEEYDRTTDAGGKGAVLRREGLYSSHIVEWRRARDAGALVGLEAKPPAARPLA